MAYKRKWMGKSPYAPRKKPKWIVKPNSRARINTAVFAANPTRKVEIKALDNNFGGGISALGQVVLLNGMAIGDATNEREGKAIQSQFWRYNFNVLNNTNVVGETYDIYLVFDKQPNGILATFSDIFTNTTVPTNPRQDTKQRYVVVKEWHGVCSNQTLTTQAVCENPTKNFSGTIPMKKITMFTGTGSTIASVNQGALYFCMVSLAGKVNYLLSSQYGYIDI